MANDSEKNKLKLARLRIFCTLTHQNKRKKNKYDNVTRFVRKSIWLLYEDPSQNLFCFVFSYIWTQFENKKNFNKSLDWTLLFRFFSIWNKSYMLTRQTYRTFSESKIPIVKAFFFFYLKSIKCYGYALNLFYSLSLFILSIYFI